MIQKQTFVALVEKTPGLVARVDALFRRQDVALESLALAGVPGLEVASITIVAFASEDKARLLAKQLKRLEDVREVLAPAPPPERREEPIFTLCLPV